MAFDADMLKGKAVSDIQAFNDMMAKREKEEKKARNVRVIAFGESLMPPEGSGIAAADYVSIAGLAPGESVTSRI